jgi:hypothetical protein
MSKYKGWKYSGKDLDDIAASHYAKALKASENRNWKEADVQLRIVHGYITPRPNSFPQGYFMLRELVNKEMKDKKYQCNELPVENAHTPAYSSSIVLEKYTQKV